MKDPFMSFLGCHGEDQHRENKRPSTMKAIAQEYCQRQALGGRLRGLKSMSLASALEVQIGVYFRPLYYVILTHPFVWLYRGAFSEPINNDGNMLSPEAS